MKIGKHQISTKWEKKTKEKHRLHKNNYIHNSSGKQPVKEVMIDGMAKKRVLKKENWSLNNGCKVTGSEDQ